MERGVGRIAGAWWEVAAAGWGGADDAAERGVAGRGRTAKGSVPVHLTGSESEHMLLTLSSNMVTAGRQLWPDDQSVCPEETDDS